MSNVKQVIEPFSAGEVPAQLAQPLLHSGHSSSTSKGDRPQKKQLTKMGSFQLDKNGAILLFCAINLWNYIDRGIIPGAPQQFQYFITSTLGIPITSQSLYLGLLASSFIASYSMFSMVFGYLSLTYRPFRMIAFGMTVWAFAVFCCGMAQYWNSYYLLLFGRVLSGVGEASFQCNATPFINTHAPKDKRALYMGVYLASITVGIAVGYIYGSTFAATSLGWGGAFITEGVIMLLLVCMCLYCIPSELDQVPKDTTTVLDEELRNSLLSSSKDGEVAAKLAKKKTPSFISEWTPIFTNIKFLFVVFGHAAYTFSFAALSVFIPVILIGLGLFESETQVSLVFGGLVVVTGTLGTPLGGLLLDRITRHDPTSPAVRTHAAVTIMFVTMTCAWIFAMIMVALTASKPLFLLFLALCFFFTCLSTAAETVAAMELFPESKRAMAIAANTLVIHVFGDVPSPVILGYLKDAWAPRCGTVEIDGEIVLNPECYRDHSGLVKVLLFPALWFFWCVILWGAAKILVRNPTNSAKP